MSISVVQLVFFLMEPLRRVSLPGPRYSKALPSAAEDNRARRKEGPKTPPRFSVSVYTQSYPCWESRRFSLMRVSAKAHVYDQTGQKRLTVTGGWQTRWNH